MVRAKSESSAGKQKAAEQLNNGKQESGKLSILQARRTYARLLKSKDVEKRAKALVSLIALERLTGNELAARSFFARCDDACKTVLDQQEWIAMLTWYCGNNSKGEPDSERLSRCFTEKKK